MKKRRLKKRKIYSKFVFWTGVFVFGIALGLVIQFTRAWVDPLNLIPMPTPPGGDIAAPINVGTATQTKNGGDICIDYLGKTTCIGNMGNAFPQGSIAMWSGALATIPSGWVLCDGTNGTPDLRGRFIQGVSNTENPGATGGSEYASVSLGGRNDISYGSGGPWIVNSVFVNATPPYYKMAFIMKQ